jgi:hypothetical protein
MDYIIIEPRLQPYRSQRPPKIICTRSIPQTLQTSCQVSFFCPAWSHIHFFDLPSTLTWDLSPNDLDTMYGPNHFHVLFFSAKFSSSRDRLILIPRQTLPKTTPMPVSGILMSWHISESPKSIISLGVMISRLSGGFVYFAEEAFFLFKGSFSQALLVGKPVEHQHRLQTLELSSIHHTLSTRDFALDASGHVSDVMWVSRNPMHPF